MLHDILEDDPIQWHPSLIRHFTNFDTLLLWTLLPNLTLDLIVWGFHRTFATGAECQQRTLSPPDTWSCPTLGLACVLMSRPISPELVLFPDFWVSNIPRYFSIPLRRRFLCPYVIMVKVPCSVISESWKSQNRFLLQYQRLQWNFIMFTFSVLSQIWKNCIQKTECMGSVLNCCLCWRH